MPPKLRYEDAFKLIGLESIRRLKERFEKPEDLLREATVQETRVLSMTQRELRALTKEELTYLRDLFGTAFVLEKRRLNRWMPLPIEDDMNFSSSGNRARGAFAEPLMTMTSLLAH